MGSDHKKQPSPGNFFTLMGLGLLVLSPEMLSSPVVLAAGGVERCPITSIWHRSLSVPISRETPFSLHLDASGSLVSGNPFHLLRKKQQRSLGASVPPDKTRKLK